jgi:hypothetical protein
MTDLANYAALLMMFVAPWMGGGEDNETGDYL